MDLIPDGQNIEVTEDNKKEYVKWVPHLRRLVCFLIDIWLTFCLSFSLITEWRISKRVEEQFKAFKEGFNQLIPQDLINVFDERELELLMGGIAEIDVDDWKKHTDYRGYTENDEVVQWFWKVSWMDGWHSLVLKFQHRTVSNIASLFVFNSASGLGMEKRNLVFCNLQLAHRVSQSMGSRISRVVMGLVVSL